MHSNGNFQYSCHAHDSGAGNIDYALTAVLVTATGTAFTFPHTGHVEGTSAALPFGTPNRNDDFNQTGTDGRVAQEWPSIVESGRIFATLTGRDKLQSALTDLLEDAAKQIAAAGVKAVIALI